jgi:hypothetical protein
MLNGLFRDDIFLYRKDVIISYLFIVFGLFKIKP